MNKPTLLLLLPLLSACTITKISPPADTPNQSIPTPSTTIAPTRSTDPDQQILDDLNQTDDKELDKSLLELESELK